MNYISDYLGEFLGLFSSMSPYLLLGFLFAGLLKVYFPNRYIGRYLGGNSVRSAMNAAILGVPLPLCSCGVLPTGISLYRNGASKGATVSFLISTPQTGVDSILATYSLLGWPFAVIRPVVAFITGVLGGMVQWLVQGKTSESRSATSQSGVEQAPRTGNRFLLMLYYGFVEFFSEIVKWLIIGLLVAALLSVIIPDDFFVRYITNDFGGMLLVLVASVPLYICATGSVPIAAVLLMKGISPGAALVLLMAGPATNVASMAVIGKTLGRSTLAVYLAVITGGALVFGHLINTLLPGEWFMQAFHLQHHGHAAHFIPGWLETSSSIVLAALVLFSLIRSLLPRQTASEQGHLSAGAAALQIKVDGMNCTHCKATVEDGLKKLSHIRTVYADHTSGVVTIDGSDLNLSQIENTLNGLGYTYKGIVDAETK